MESLGYIQEKSFEEAFNEPISASFYGIGSEVEADYLSEQIRRYMIENYGLSSYKGRIQSLFYNQLFETIGCENGILYAGVLKEYEFRHGFRKPNNFKELISKISIKEVISFIKLAMTLVILRTRWS